MIVHQHLKISPALDKLLHRVIYCSPKHSCCIVLFVLVAVHMKIVLLMTNNSQGIVVVT